MLFSSSIQWKLHVIKPNYLNVWKTPHTEESDIYIYFKLLTKWINFTQRLCRKKNKIPFWYQQNYIEGEFNILKLLKLEHSLCWRKVIWCKSHLLAAVLFYRINDWRTFIAWALFCCPSFSPLFYITRGN